jgi:hypothetical protein
MPDKTTDGSKRDQWAAAMGTAAMQERAFLFRGRIDRMLLQRVKRNFDE